MLAHIANGMYGAIIVDPKGGLPKVDKSVVLVSSEWYLSGAGGKAPYVLDFSKAVKKQPDFVTWNGYAAQYKDHPLTANARPDRALLRGRRRAELRHRLPRRRHRAASGLSRRHDDATSCTTCRRSSCPAGGGMIFDVTFHQKGIYPFVSHSFASVDMGEVGLVNVGNVPGTMSH